MNFLSRLIARFRSPPKPSKYDNTSAEELLASVERLMLQAVKGYVPHGTLPRPCYAQAEYACIIYFWVQHWHDQQPKEIRSYGIILKLLMSKAQDGASAIRIFHMLNHMKGWDPDVWFNDRIRFYRSILTFESQKSSGGPPSVFVACHLLAMYSERRRALEVLPHVKSSSDILKLCLSQQIFGDALEQLNLYNHCTAAMNTVLPLITEIITEMHLRRLSK
jgi:hypothetical protein